MILTSVSFFIFVKHILFNFECIFDERAKFYFNISIFNVAIKLVICYKNKKQEKIFGTENKTVSENVCTYWWFIQLVSIAVTKLHRNLFLTLRNTGTKMTNDNFIQVAKQFGFIWNCLFQVWTFFWQVKKSRSNTNRARGLHLAFCRLSVGCLLSPVGLLPKPRWSCGAELTSAQKSQSRCARLCHISHGGTNQRLSFLAYLFLYFNSRTSTFILSPTLFNNFPVAKCNCNIFYTLR